MHRMRRVLYTKDAMPFLIAGSGTLGWDQVAANLVEPGESVLLLNSCGAVIRDPLLIGAGATSAMPSPTASRSTAPT